MNNRTTIMIMPINNNATVLNATNVENGTLIDALGENVSVGHNLSTRGVATINASFATYPGMVNGDGELFNLTSHAKTVGDPVLDIMVTGAWTIDVAPVTVGGDVNVTTAGVVTGIPLQTGWNMVSLPALPDDATIGSVFGSSVTPVFGWNGTGCTQATESQTLELGTGYWMLASSETVVQV